MNDCATGILVEFNMSDTSSTNLSQLSLPKDSSINKTKDDAAEHCANMLHTCTSETDNDDLFFCHQMKKLSKVPTAGPLYKSPLCGKLIDIADEPNSSPECPSYEKQKDTTPEEQEKSTQHLTSYKPDKISSISCSQSVCGNVCFKPENEQKSPVDSHSSTDKNSCWRLVEDEEELLENEAFDFNISITPPGPLRTGQDDVLQELNIEKNPMKKYNQDEGPTLKSGFTKLSDTSDNWQPVSCGEITKKPSIIVCCSSNKEHKLGLEYESTVSNHNINSNLLPDLTSKLLILTGESTDIQTKSKTVALQTDETDLYPKMEGLTSTSELKTKTSEPSYDMLTSPVSIENKENYFSVNETWQEASQFIDSTLPYPSPEKNPDGSICQDDRAIRRRGTFTLKESPLVAERNIIKYPEEQISLEKTEKKSKLRRETILLSSPLTEMKSISKDSSFQNNSPVQRVGNTKPSLYMKARISLSNQVTSYNRRNATSSLNRSQELSQNHSIKRPDKMPKSYQNHSKILQKTTNDTSVNRLSKVSIINDKCGTTVTSGLKPPNSLSKSNKCGSSTSPVPSCLSLPRRSGLPKATTSIKHLSVGQASNTKIRGNSNSLKLSTKKSVVGPRENKMNQNLAKTGVNKTLETKKCAPLKATAPINLMIKSNIRDIRGSNHTVGSPRRDASITQRSSSFISTGQHTPSRRSFDISLSTPTLTSTPSTPKPFRSSVLGTPFSNDKGKVVRRRSGLPAPSWLHHPKTIDI